MMHAALLAAMVLSQNAPRAEDREPPEAPKVKPATEVLAIGSKAPPMTVDAWVQGEPVKAFEPGRVYVVEFWATWCGPCVRSMPHMTELQKQYPEVAIIGVAASERGPGDRPDLGIEAPPEDARVTNIRKFLKSQGDKVGYRIAFDGDGTMGRSWLLAARQRGIPWACVIGRDGCIRWMGHPDSIDPAISAAVRAPKPPPPATQPPAGPPTQPPSRR